MPRRRAMPIAAIVLPVPLEPKNSAVTPPPYGCAGEPDEQIATALAWQIRTDLVDHPDHDDVCDLIAAWSVAIMAGCPDA